MLSLNSVVVSQVSRDVLFCGCDFSEFEMLSLNSVVVSQVSRDVPYLDYAPPFPPFPG